MRFRRCRFPVLISGSTAAALRWDSVASHPQAAFSELGLVFGFIAPILYIPPTPMSILLSLGEASLSPTGISPRLSLAAAEKRLSLQTLSRWFIFTHRFPAHFHTYIRKRT